MYNVAVPYVGIHVHVMVLMYSEIVVNVFSPLIMYSAHGHTCLLPKCGYIKRQLQLV